MPLGFKDSGVFLTTNVCDLLCDLLRVLELDIRRLLGWVGLVLLEADDDIPEQVVILVPPRAFVLQLGLAVAHEASDVFLLLGSRGPYKGRPRRGARGGDELLILILGGPWLEIKSDTHIIYLCY